MGAKTKIEWTAGDDGAMGATWNPTRGCSRVSAGCTNCYAESIAARFSGPGKPFAGFAERNERGAHWTGRVELVPSVLDLPLRWRRPRRVFVNSMSDLFHETLSNEDIAAVFGVMAACPQHTFQCLTKRAERMREWCGWAARQGSDYCIGDRMLDAASRHVGGLRGAAMVQQNRGRRWPLPNVWLGVSVEDQATADERIPHLLATPAAVRFVSYEPALGPVDFGRATGNTSWDGGSDFPADRTLDWLIVGGESGLGARPFSENWARSARDQCVAAGVAFFYKQRPGARPGSKVGTPELDGRVWMEFPEVTP